MFGWVGRCVWILEIEFVGRINARYITCIGCSFYSSIFRINDYSAMCMSDKIQFLTGYGMQNNVKNRRCETIFKAILRSILSIVKHYEKRVCFFKMAENVKTQIIINIGKLLDIHSFVFYENIYVMMV